MKHLNFFICFRIFRLAKIVVCLEFEIVSDKKTKLLELLMQNFYLSLSHISLILAGFKFKFVKDNLYLFRLNSTKYVSHGAPIGRLLKVCFLQMLRLLLNFSPELNLNVFIKQLDHPLVFLDLHFVLFQLVLHVRSIGARLRDCREVLFEVVIYLLDLLF